MQAVIESNKKWNVAINANEMCDIIKKAIKNKKPVIYYGLFQSIEKNPNTLIQKIKLNENNISFQFFTLKDDEVIKKIEETIASSKQSRENLTYYRWSISDQEKSGTFLDLSLVLSLVLEKMKLYVYFQILIENDLYIIDYSTFKELYKMMNEKSINYIFTKKVKIKSCNPPLNFNSENVLDTSFWLPFEILVENKENNKTLSYILTGYTFIKCSNNEVIEEKKRGMFFTDIQKLFL